MNPFTVLLGFALVCYGLYTAWARRAKPEQFRKLDAMKRFWGEKNGQLVHIVGYTVVPILSGSVVILIGLSGTSLF